MRNDDYDYGAERDWEQVRCPSHLRLDRRGEHGRGRGNENIDRNNSLIRSLSHPLKRPHAITVRNGCCDYGVEW